MTISQQDMPNNLSNSNKRKISFTKMQGAGNDYIYVDINRFPIHNPQGLSVILSAYHTGIGSDGLVLIGPSEKADFSMRIFNADGSEAMMCGNASRCIGKYVFEKGLTDKTEFTLETLSGIKIIRLHLDDNTRINTVSVDMGIPECRFKEQVVAVGDFQFHGTSVSMGNPHLVIFVEDLNEIDLPVVGPMYEHHPLFPDRVNVEFAQVLRPNVIRMRVWERGSGITQACGTGACATATAAFLTGRCGRKSEIIMDGGTLSIDWEEDSQHLFMTGGADLVFEGNIEIED